MLNIWFSLFLFGMLIAACYTIFTHAIKNDRAITSQELALVISLCLGALIALHRGAYKLYGVPLNLF